MLSNFLETEIIEKLSLPHIVFAQGSLAQKVKLAWHVYSLSPAELLLASCFSFSYPAIVAGITVESIEYFAKNAPAEFKKELAKTFLAEYRMKEVFEITKMMDDDLGNGIKQNQERIKKVYQYIVDNWAVFQF